MAIFPGVCPVIGLTAMASDVWHVEGNPRVLSQEIRFANGNANLVGFRRGTAIGFL